MRKVLMKMFKCSCILEVETSSRCSQLSPFYAIVHKKQVDICNEPQLCIEHAPDHKAKFGGRQAMSQSLLPSELCATMSGRVESTKMS